MTSTFNTPAVKLTQQAALDTDSKREKPDYFLELVQAFCTITRTNAANCRAQMSNFQDLQQRNVAFSEIALASANEAINSSIQILDKMREIEDLQKDLEEQHEISEGISIGFLCLFGIVGLGSGLASLAVAVEASAAAGAVEGAAGAVLAEAGIDVAEVDVDVAANVAENAADAGEPAEALADGADPIDAWADGLESEVNSMAWSSAKRYTEGLIVQGLLTAPTFVEAETKKKIGKLQLELAACQTESGKLKGYNEECNHYLSFWQKGVERGASTVQSLTEEVSEPIELITDMIDVYGQASKGSIKKR